MANIKSAKKQAKKSLVRRKKNLARKTAMKTAAKKVIVALENNDSIAKVKALLRDAEAKIARAKGKNVLHPKTASRKVSRLAKRVAKIERNEAQQSA